MERFTPPQPEYYSNRDLGDEDESGAERMEREMRNYEREQEKLLRELEENLDDGYFIK